MNGFIAKLISTVLACTILTLCAIAEEEALLHGKPISYWAELLKSNDIDLQIQAKLALAKIGAPSVPALIAALKNPTSTDSALDALREIGPKSAPAVPAILELLAKPGGVSKTALLSTLERIGPGAKAALPSMLIELRDKFSKNKRNALEVIRAIMPETELVLADLAEGLKDPNPDIRESVVEVLIKLKDKPELTKSMVMNALKDPSPKVRAAAVLAVDRYVRNDPEVGQTLLSMLPQQSDASCYSRITNTLSGNKQMRAPLQAIHLAALENKDAKIRARAMGSLEATPQNVEKILQFTKDPDVEMRRWAIYQLMNGLTNKVIKVDSAIFREGMKEEDEYIRVHCISALASLQENPELIKASLHDSTPGVRQRALEVIGYKHESSRDSLPEIINALSDENAYVRTAACDALRAVDKSGTAATPQIIRLLTDKNVTVRRSAIQRLADIHTAESTNALIDILAESDQHAQWSVLRALRDHGTAAATAFEKILPFLKSEDADMRLQAIDALYAISNDAETVLPAIFPLARDKNERVRQQVAETISYFGRKALTGVPILIEMLKDENLEVRRSAVTALAEVGGRIGDAAKDALPALDDIAKDQAREENSIAKEAAQRIRERIRIEELRKKK